MSKMIKDLITRELQERYGSLDSALWIEMTGVDGIATNEFRRELRAKQMRLEIVKTSLFRRAVADQPLATLARHFAGPVALITCRESVIDAAKVIEGWLPKIKGLRLRGALLEGQYLDEKAVGGLSKMPTKRDLQARLVSVIRAPGANLAAAILAGRAGVAGCLKALADKLEESEGQANAA